jgi:SAM-dependent methyltransferase
VGARNPSARPLSRGLSSTRRADPELEAGTSAHYDDPAYYARAYAKRTDDVRFYVEEAVGSGGPVLEYGCGNGRIALPTARAGVETWGLDLSAPMLADLRARLASEPRDVRARVHVRRGRMESARLRQRFALVTCPFNGLLHLYDFRLFHAFLQRVRAHLAPGGRFLFDVSVPDPDELARDPAVPHGVPPFKYPTEQGDVLVRYRERFDYDAARQVLFVAMEFEPKNGSPGWMTPLAHRQYFPQELEALLYFGGFEFEERYADFDRSPFDKSARHLVAVCRPRRGR